MTNSFATLVRNISNILTWITPYYYKFLYYFAVPTVIATGKLKILKCFSRTINEAKESNC